MKSNSLTLGFSLLLTLGITSCNNKGEYFEKSDIALNKNLGNGTVDGGAAGGNTGEGGGSNTGEGGRKSRTEIFKQKAEQINKLDILWVIDDSGSMADEQSALGTNFSAFMDNFIMKDVDFKMAITTTDTTSYRRGTMVPGSDQKLTSQNAQANPDAFKAEFRSMVKVGTFGSPDEKGLEAAENFMTKSSATFLRPDAFLAVVIISDEEDQSPKTVAQYADLLKAYKKSGGLVKIYSVVDVNKTNCCDRGIATGAERYKLASKLTGGVVANIRDDFYNVLTDMGDSIISILDSFPLAGEPVAGTLLVYVNGVSTKDYTYDAVAHTIKFNKNTTPAIGAEIKVTYLQ